jgi:hypothetical protein
MGSLFRSFLLTRDWFSVRSTKNMYPDVWLLVLGLSGSQVKALRNADE